jgi:hypothetical protein
MLKNKILSSRVLFALILTLITSFVNSAESQNSQKKVSIGVFITSLYEFNMSAGTYNADIWIWSESNIKDKFELDKVELGQLHGKYPLDISLKYQENLDEFKSFENRKIRATFLHDYNLDLFPFDKQILRFNIEGTDSADELVFIPSNNSGISNSIPISGWLINSFKIISSEIDHGTNFGYPKYTYNAKYPMITVEVELIRNSFFIFFKLIIGLLVSVLIASLSSTISVYNDDLYGSRISIIGGSLLAAVLNQQFADTKSDAINTITLVDSIHLIGILTIGCLFMSTIIFRFFSEKTDKKSKLQKIDLFFGLASFALFIIISTIIIIASI